LKLSFIFSILVLSSAAFCKPVDSQVWLKSFTADFKKEFCSSKAIQHCYQKVSSECLNITDELTTSCFKELQVAKTVAMGPESGQLGAQIGRCVGRKIESKYQKKNSEDKLCQSLF